MRDRALGRHAGGCVRCIRYPLYAHASKQWAKKIKGRTHYFGPWANPQAALDLFLTQRDDLYAGRTPRVSGDRLTIAGLCNEFLTAKQHKLTTGEIVARTFRDYHAACLNIVTALGENRSVNDLTPADFEQLRRSLAKIRGLIALSNEITRCRRSVFKFATDKGLVEHPIRYGQRYGKPAKRALRRARADNGSRMFEADELRTIIDAATIGSPQATEHGARTQRTTLPVNDHCAGVSTAEVPCPQPPRRNL